MIDCLDRQRALEAAQAPATAPKPVPKHPPTMDLQVWIPSGVGAKVWDKCNRDAKAFIVANCGVTEDEIPHCYTDMFARIIYLLGIAGHEDRDMRFNGITHGLISPHWHGFGLFEGYFLGLEKLLQKWKAQQTNWDYYDFDVHSLP